MDNRLPAPSRNDPPDYDPYPCCEVALPVAGATLRRLASKSMKRSIILVAFFALALQGCNRASSPPDEANFITSTGTFKVLGGQLAVTVVETQDGGINYTVTRGTSTAGPAEPLIRKGRPWLIYAASPDAVWMHDGEANVLLIELSEEGSKFTSSSVVPDLLQRAPPAFLDRLPSKMKK